MTRFDTLTPVDDLHRAMDAMVASHGLLRVLMAALRPRLRPPPARRKFRARELSNHIRRDIGLSPVATSPPDRIRFP